MRGAPELYSIGLQPAVSLAPNSLNIPTPMQNLEASAKENKRNVSYITTPKDA